MTTFFKIPFAAQGDKEDIPLTTQADGSVSYAQGYGIDYEREYADDLAKDIPRKKENKLFHDMTEAIGEMQQLGLPKWNTDGKPYPINTVLSHDNKAFISLKGNNNVTPVNGTDWLDVSLTLLAAANKVEVAEAISILNDKVDNALTTKADKTIKLSAGIGLEGGGDLSDNRSLRVKYGNTAGTAVQGNDSRLGFSLTVGACYTQYPGTPTPTELFGGTWQKLFANEGVFFRTEGGNAQSFASPKPQVDLFKSHGHTGSTSTDGGHAHTFPIYSGYARINMGGTGDWNGGRFTGTTDAAGDHSHTVNIAVNGGVETRPINRTIVVWQRTA